MNIKDDFQLKWFLTRLSNVLYVFSNRSTVVLSDLYAFVNKPESCSSSCCTCVDGADRPAVLPASEHHVWGRIAEIGKISIEVSFEILIMVFFMVYSRQ